jgi:hypothetical protein
MSGQRKYPEGVRAALHLMSGGGCYRPQCGEPAIRFVDGVPEINLEIAHIHAFENGGPREIPQMPVPERNMFSNLIWLCIPCHKRVDADEQAYAAALLKKWKRDRESRPLGRLAGLRDLDVAGMEELLQRAMADIRQDMAAFTEKFPDLATVLRETIEGLPSLDPESLELLSDAAHRLALPDYAPIMHSAAARLDLPDFAPMVHHSALNLELPDYAPMLAQAALNLKLPDHAPMLTQAARDLDLVNQVPLLCGAARSLERTAATISATAGRIEAAYTTEPSAAYQVQVPYTRRRVPWKAVALGLLGWALTGLLIYLHVAGHF